MDASLWMEDSRFSDDSAHHDLPAEKAAMQMIPSSTYELFACGPIAVMAEAPSLWRCHFYTGLKINLWLLLAQDKPSWLEVLQHKNEALDKSPSHYSQNLKSQPLYRLSNWM
jgi:hypothetical protein